MHTKDCRALGAHSTGCGNSIMTSKTRSIVRVSVTVRELRLLSDIDTSSCQSHVAANEIEYDDVDTKSVKLIQFIDKLSESIGVISPLTTPIKFICEKRSILLGNSEIF